MVAAAVANFAARILAPKEQTRSNPRTICAIVPVDPNRKCGEWVYFVAWPDPALRKSKTKMKSSDVEKK